MSHEWFNLALPTTKLPYNKTHKLVYFPLTKIHKIGHALLPTESGARALIIEADEYVQQGLHTNSMSAAALYTTEV